MIQPIFAVAFVEVVLTLTLLFRSPMRKLMVMVLDMMKRGRGPVVAKTVAATLFMIFISILYNIIKVQKRSAEAGSLNPSDQILLLNHLLEACLLGFTLFLALIIDRLHYYMKELSSLRKSLKAAKKSNHEIIS